MSTRRFAILTLAGIVAIDATVWLWVHARVTPVPGHPVLAVIEANLVVTGVNLCLTVLAAVGYMMARR